MKVAFTWHAIIAKRRDQMEVIYTTTLVYDHFQS